MCLQIRKQDNQCINTSKPNCTMETTWIHNFNTSKQKQQHRKGRQKNSQCLKQTKSRKIAHNPPKMQPSPRRQIGQNTVQFPNDQFVQYEIHRIQPVQITKFRIYYYTWHHKTDTFRIIYDIPKTIADKVQHTQNDQTIHQCCKQRQLQPVYSEAHKNKNPYSRALYYTRMEPSHQARNPVPNT